MHKVQNAFQFEDDVTKTIGAHTVKFGSMEERFQWNTAQAAITDGSITFSNLDEFLLAGPSGTSATFLLPGSNYDRDMHSTLISFFAQDDWRIAPRFMLSYGLRWEFTTGISERPRVAFLPLAGAPINSTYPRHDRIALQEPHRRFSTAYRV